MITENQKIGERLLQERVRMGWNQTEMAKRGQVGVSTYSSYESGNSSPKAESLQLWAACGIDILYVITGQAIEGKLSPDEMMLLGHWRDSPDEIRSAVLGFYRSYAIALREK
ncbi:helix-turn-helix domain-containing protein [Chromobacterium violaceum]|uniref:helix-turn-helix domain-containing protein n=1 Tax=Chromobacterium violaceum TaxID=536 RepID=UPI0005BACFA0|nr:helix-turn-helix transcriptional regulator [Chromobacterium violaceum]